MLPKLYELTDDYNKLIDVEEPDDFERGLLNIVCDQLEKKTENICHVVRIIDSQVDIFRAEEKRLKEIRQSLENRAQRVREFLRDALLSANIDKVKAGTFSVSVGLSPGTLEIDDPTKIPPRYFTVIPEQYVPDKNAIKAAIKEGTLTEGAHIEAGYMLRIR